jgi:DNA polymerase I-like protein with 3'-5' exonuclease and polymerase domains
MNVAVGNTDAPYLIVMLSPPSDKMNSWFLRKLLAAGIRKSDVRFVYLLDEPPRGAGGKPLAAQLRGSQERFEQEIAESFPKVVLAMGGDIVRVLTGVSQTIFDSRGYVITDRLHRNVDRSVYMQVGEYKTSNKKVGRLKGDPKMKWQKQASSAYLTGRQLTVIPIFTLDHIRAEGFALSPVLKEDLLRARRVVEGNLRRVDENFTYLTTPAEFALATFPLSAYIAVDIETHGIDNEVIDLVSVSDGVTSASFQWDEQARAVIEGIFNLRGVYFTLHNSPFDLPRLRANGVNIPKDVEERLVFDTMFGAVVIQPDLHKSLGRVASLYLDCEPWKWRILSEADPRRYSALDAYMTALLARQEAAVMKALGTWNLFMGQGDHPGPGEMATIPTLTEASRLGIPINTEYVQWWAPRLERNLLRLSRLWDNSFPDTKWSSPAALRKLLYGEWGLPVQRTREEGASTDELALVALRAFVAAQKPLTMFDGEWKKDPRCTPRVFDLLLKLRDTGKTLGTYVAPVLDGFAMGQTYVHPQYLPVSKDAESGSNKTMSSKGNTATGRLASYNPNIQNQPKKTRVLYVPENGHCFVQADYKSAELYVMAWMAGDKRLLDDLGGDMHQKNADRLGISRKVAKNVTYASQYLAGPSKQSEMILKQEHMYVPPSECLRVADGIWGHYSRVKTYKEHLVNLCKQKKYIKNPFGRIRFFHANEAPAAVDYIPQSTVADVLWCVLKPVAEMAKRYGGRLYTTVHDSILIAVPLEHREAAAREMKEIMEKRFDIVAPGFFIPVEVEWAGPGEPWSKVKKVELVEAA